MTYTNDIYLLIVTYKRNEVLNANLRSLFSGARSGSRLQVTVLSNHPDLEIEPENRRENLRVVMNTTRMTHAWGYLARDWNFGILDAFGDSGNRNGVRWCVLAQNDVEWQEGWDEKLLAIQDFDIVTQPMGDQVVALNMQAVNAIGFFDERFTTLHYQEQDYFLRAMMALGPRASITDAHSPEPEKESWNPLGTILIHSHKSGLGDETLHSTRNWSEMTRFMCEKWELPSNIWLHHKRLLSSTISEQYRKKLREINWYPFFWKNHEPATEAFIDHKRVSISTFRKLRLALRWRFSR